MLAGLNPALQNFLLVLQIGERGICLLQQMGLLLGINIHRRFDGSTRAFDQSHRRFGRGRESLLGLLDVPLQLLLQLLGSCFAASLFLSNRGLVNRFFTTLERRLFFRSFGRWCFLDRHLFCGSSSVLLGSGFFSRGFGCRSFGSRSFSFNGGGFRFSSRSLRFNGRSLRISGRNFRFVSRSLFGLCQGDGPDFQLADSIKDAGRMHVAGIELA